MGNSSLVSFGEAASTPLGLNYSLGWLINTNYRGRIPYWLVHLGHAPWETGSLSIGNFSKVGRCFRAHIQLPEPQCVAILTWDASVPQSAMNALNERAAGSQRLSGGQSPDSLSLKEALTPLCNSDGSNSAFSKLWNSLSLSDVLLQLLSWTYALKTKVCLTGGWFYLQST